MSTKKLSLAILSVAALASLASCNTAKDDTISLKVWVPSEEQETMETIITNFKAANPDKKYSITIENVAEGDTRQTLQQDPDAAADVFATTDDSCQALGEAGQVYEIPTASTYYTNVTTLNSESTVTGVTLNGKVYGFPETADNGFFLYYNSNYVTDEEATSFNAIVEKATKLNKSFYFDYTNGWYAISYLNCNGGSIGHNEDGIYCNWATAAVEPTKVMYSLAAQSGLVANSSNDNIAAGMADGSVIAAFTGTWMYTQLSAIDGMKCAECPYLTLSDGTTKKHMQSFSGGKVVCVNAVTKNPTEAMRLADFMTNEASQTIRFNNRSIGPSNKAVGASDAVAANPALKALAAQSVYAVSQSATLNSAMDSVYWDAAGGVGTHLKSQDWADETAMTETLKTVADTIVAAK